ncbi:ion channel [Roseivirga sp. BDSF3-8]|uniref:substrate-binding periplasmic protein n=1 Tax=Roseivirga sp. BDSF3-8 TaxID=3241598 RepID=UPI0035320F89
MRIIHFILLIPLLFFTTPKVVAIPLQQDSTAETSERRIIPLDSLTGDATWHVGVYHKPPFMIREGEGQWDGIAIRLWEDLAEAINLTYDYREISEDKANEVLASGQADIIPALPVTADASGKTVYTQNYYLSMLGVADSRGKKLSRIAKSLFTWRFFQIVISLSILLAVVGLLIWVVEKKINDKQFGGERSFWHGLGAGFWWAGVTMTTIGYGDKAPVTPLGRVIALLWMLIAMGITASLTAAIVGAVNDSVQGASSIPEDLRGHKTAVIEGSPFATYLDDKNVKLTHYTDIQEALNELNVTNETSFFVHDIAEMRYYVSQMDNVNVRTTATELLPRHYALALPVRHEAYVPHLNKALLEIITRPEWLKEANSFAPNIKNK